MPGNVTVWATGKSENVYGLSSGYSSVVSITSAKDTTAPAVPGSFSAVDGVQSFVGSWAAVSDLDLAYYQIAYAVDDGSGTGPGGSPTYTVIDVKATNIVIHVAAGRWWAKVRAVDTSGNASAYTSLDSADSRLVSTADIGSGQITHTLIGDGEIQTPALAANAVTTDKLAAGSVQVGQIAAPVDGGNLCPNGSFEILSPDYDYGAGTGLGDALTTANVAAYVPGWTAIDTPGTGGTPSVSVSDTNSGAGKLRMGMQCGSTTGTGRMYSDYVPVQPGKVYACSMLVRGAAANSGNAYAALWIRQYKADKTAASTSEKNACASYNVGTTPRGSSGRARSRPTRTRTTYRWSRSIHRPRAAATSLGSTTSPSERPRTSPTTRGPCSSRRRASRSPTAS